LHDSLSEAGAVARSPAPLESQAEAEATDQEVDASLSPGEEERLDAVVRYLDRQLDVPSAELLGALSPPLLLLRALTLESNNIRRLVYHRVRVCQLGGQKQGLGGNGDRLTRQPQLLPRRHDFSVGPEHGSSLRARLIKLMTSPDSAVKHMVAEFPFVLCHRNGAWTPGHSSLDNSKHGRGALAAARLVFHSGYGNAAGFLNAQGLMHSAMARDQHDGSDSEDDW
jgi:hypothetical protein